jgi:glycosyltransferase involved in cell wall biosynthesis
VQNYVAAADALVLPYTEILTSGSAMLGLSFGIPVIVPDIGGMADVITEECGLLYDANAADGLFRSMNDIRSRKYSAPAIVQYARRFDWSISAEALVSSIARLKTNASRLQHKY